MRFTVYRKTFVGVASGEDNRRPTYGTIPHPVFLNRCRGRCVDPMRLFLFDDLHALIVSLVGVTCAFRRSHGGGARR